MAVFTFEILLDYSKLHLDSNSWNKLDEPGSPFTGNKMGLGLEPGVEPRCTPGGFKGTEHMVCNKKVRRSAGNSKEIVRVSAHLAVEKEMG